MSPKAALLLTTLLMFASLGLSQNPNKEPHKNAQQGCREFVQDFYDWYVPVALQKHSEIASDIALKVKPVAFDPELLRLLRRDSEAQLKASELDGIVGLDFDPFLGQDGPNERYQTKRVRSGGASCLVSVLGFSEGEKRMEIVAEVKFSNGRWRFFNFHYADGKKRWNLIDVLNSWESDRQAVHQAAIAVGKSPSRSLPRATAIGRGRP